ncbi:MAG: prepilin peptidase [Ruminococcaceae bacterium]|nr:prepilin peptidase [Oscillospiraceae bacterium]
MKSEIILNCIVIAILIWIAVVDIKQKRIPNKLVVLIVVVGAIKVLFIKAYVETFIATIIAVLIIGICQVLSKEGIGMGDIKLLIALAFYCGIKKFCISMLIISVTAFLTAMGLLIFRRIDKKATLPFAPFIAIGFIGSTLV